MQCSTCDRENRPEARFCDGCGGALDTSCGQCGQSLRPEARFCDACGTPVASASAPAAPEGPARTPRDYTPRHLADKILRSQSALQGERKQVTVMFADVQGSMELAEELGAEAWHRILDRFFEILSEGVHRFEGTVNQYTGDGIMALFGAPIAHEDHAQRACFSALHLHDKLRGYADELRRTKGVSLSTRIGLNSGDVVVGKIGDDLRMDYTAKGHTVGLAQRMESRAASDSTYLTEHTARIVEGFFALRALGAFELKGVRDPTEVFALEGLGELRTRLDRSRARGFSRFVGRAEEVEQLDAALERTLEGRGGVVGVVAEAGVGKSRLCLEFVERCRARGIAVYEAHCPSHGKAIPLLPVFELLRGLFGLQEGDSEQFAREKITGRLMLLDRSFEPLLPLAFDFLGVGDPAAPLGPLDAAVRQRQLLALVRQLVQARSAREPAVLLLDDAHWIDPSSEVFLEALVDTVPGTRTLLLLNFRPEFSADWMSRSSYQQLPLHPLGDEATEALLRDLLGEHPSLAPLGPLVRERSSGNPFYVEEIVQNLIESGSLAGERGAFELIGAVGNVEVPSTVHAILGARIDRLPEREKHLLQTAAAIGRRFGESLLRCVAELPDADFDEAIRALSHAEFIHEEVLYPEVEYAFRHPLTHEVAERSQLADRRCDVHAAVARELERMHQGASDERAALLAHHWDEAGDAARAAQWHARAAEWIAGGNPPEASRHWYRVRELSDQIDDDALAAELGERSRLMVLEWTWRVGASEQETSALVEEGEAWARSRGDSRALAALYNAYSMPLCLTHGRVDRAREVVEQGLQLVEGGDDRTLEFALELRRYLVAEFAGHVDEMERYLERVHSFSMEEMESATPTLGYDAPSLAIGYPGNAATWRGDFPAALDFYARGLERARSCGSEEVTIWLLANQLECLVCMGELERAVSVGQEALSLAEKTDGLLGIAMGSCYLGRAVALQGEFREARTLTERGTEACLIASRTVLPEGRAVLALCQLGLGEPVRARETALAALEESGNSGLAKGELVALLALARIDAQGDGTAARQSALESLERVEALSKKWGLRHRLPEAFEIRAQLAGSGSPRDALLDQARELYAQMGAPRQVTRLEALRGSSGSSGSSD